MRSYGGEAPGQLRLWSIAILRSEPELERRIRGGRKPLHQNVQLCEQSIYKGLNAFKLIVWNCGPRRHCVPW